MKKLFSTLLTLIFVLSFGSVAFATDNGSSGYTDAENINFGKQYKIMNVNNVSPLETFIFKIEKFNVSDSQYTLETMPMFDPATFTIDFAEGEATLVGDVNIAPVALPVYDYVGIYSYKLTEIPGNTAGVMYEPQTLILKITVINDNGVLKRIPALRYMLGKEKTQNFNNEYSAGDLAVKKTVTGNLGDREKNFTVEVTFTAPEGKVVKAPIKYMNDGFEEEIVKADWVDGKVTATITLKHDETITFTNIPYGVSYQVKEADYSGDGYAAPVYSKETGVINVAAEGVEITNNKNADVDTGISLDSIPYIMILGLAVLGISGLFLRRRKNTNF